MVPIRRVPVGRDPSRAVVPVGVVPIGRVPVGVVPVTRGPSTRSSSNARDTRRTNRSDSGPRWRSRFAALSGPFASDKRGGDVELTGAVWPARVCSGRRIQHPLELIGFQVRIPLQEQRLPRLRRPVSPIDRAAQPNVGFVGADTNRGSPGRPGHPRRPAPSRSCDQARRCFGLATPVLGRSAATEAAHTIVGRADALVCRRGSRP